MENKEILLNQKPKKRGRPKKEKKPVLVNEEIKVLQMQEDIKQESPNKVTIDDIKNIWVNAYKKVFNFNNIEDKSTTLKALNNYNPFILNSRLKRISSSPSAYSKEDIAEAVKNPQNSEQVLRETSWSLSSSQFLYYKILRNASDIPLYNYYKIPANLPEQEYSGKTFKDEDVFLEDWLNVFDIKNTFKRISLEVKREGKSTYILRNSITEEENIKQTNFAYLQKLPSNFVKLTGIGQHGYLASFNMMVFLQPGFDPKQYPSVIQKIWTDMQDKGLITEDKKRHKNIFNIAKATSYSFGYKASKLSSIIENSKKDYMFWVQLPEEICYTFCSDTSHVWAVPDTAALFLDLQELTDYSVLAGLIASSPLSAVLTAEAEMVDNAKPGQDESKLNAETLLGLQNMFNAMTSGNIEAYFAPLSGFKLHQLQNVPNNTNIKTEALRNFLNTAGEGGTLIATEKPSIAQVKGSQILEASQCNFVTIQFESILNYIINNNLGLTFKWIVRLWGNIYTIDSEKKYLKELVNAGCKFLLPKLLSAENLSILNSKAITSYIDSLKLYDNLSGFVPTKSTVEDKNTVGRPSISEDEIENDNTAKSRDAGNNVSDNKDFSQQLKCKICEKPLTETDNFICKGCLKLSQEVCENKNG